MKALLIDLDGVLYQGEGRVAGAAETVAWAAERRIPHLFLTNTTSRPRAALVEKLAEMAIATDAEHIHTPPVAARGWLHRHAPGPVALFVPEATGMEFEGVERLSEGAESGATAVVLGDLGPGWSFERLNRAFRLLMDPCRPPLVALGMTRYWRAPDGLRLDVAPFVKALEHATGREALVLGKPSTAFFEAACAALGTEAGETVMVGDDIVGDVQAARRAGLRGVLVRTGKFRPEDLQGEIEPDAVLDSIADLPAWWDRG